MVALKASQLAKLRLNGRPLPLELGNLRGMLSPRIALHRRCLRACSRHDVLSFGLSLRNRVLGGPLRERQGTKRGLARVLGLHHRRCRSGRGRRRRGGRSSLGGRLQRRVLGEEPSHLSLDLVEKGIDFYLVIARLEARGREAFVLNVLWSERHCRSPQLRWVVKAVSRIRITCTD
jgi:hypothetical protein